MLLLLFSSLSVSNFKLPFSAAKLLNLNSLDNCFQYWSPPVTDWFSFHWNSRSSSLSWAPERLNFIIRLDWGRRSKKVVFVLLTQQPWVRISTLPKFICRNFERSDPRNLLQRKVDSTIDPPKITRLDIGGNSNSLVLYPLALIDLISDRCPHFEWVLGHV